MFRKKHLGLIICGLCAGIVNGLFGAGGGMVLIPTLTLFPTIHEKELFSSSVAIILPICIISLIFALPSAELSMIEALPYLLGSFLGGIAAPVIGKRLPTLFLHKLLGIFILWGGIRYLC